MEEIWRENNYKHFQKLVVGNQEGFLFSFFLFLHPDHFHLTIIETRT